MQLGFVGQWADAASLTVDSSYVGGTSILPSWKCKPLPTNPKCANCKDQTLKFCLAVNAPLIDAENRSLLFYACDGEKCDYWLVFERQGPWDVAEVKNNNEDVVASDAAQSPPEASKEPTPEVKFSWGSGNVDGENADDSWADLGALSWNVDNKSQTEETKPETPLKVFADSDEIKNQLEIKSIKSTPPKRKTTNADKNAFFISFQAEPNPPKVTKNITKRIEKYDNSDYKVEEFIGEEFEANEHDAFIEFSERVGRSAQQLVRYHRNGEPLRCDRVIDEDVGPLDGIPRCDCGKVRVFECQLMPNLVSHLKNVVGIECDWTTVLVYPCSVGCGLDPWVETLSV